MNKHNESAIFAGGCFWCMVSSFHILDGIIEVKSGYIGGHVENPKYEEVKKQNTGHYEAVQIIYDPEIISYEKLLKAFWVQINPTDDGGQFHDRGPQYRSAIFYTNETQKVAAELSRKQLEDSKRFSDPIVTNILPASKFYDAEEYHQDYYKKEPENYKKDRSISGRDEFIEKYWRDEFFSLFQD
ncbi:MAG: peptide-methionine (S)-S-oxide reductase MsrA [Solirubrobacterales bacterium]